MPASPQGSRKRRPPKAIQLPPGFEGGQVSLFLPSSEVDFDRLIAPFKGVPKFQIRTDNLAIRGVLKSPGFSPPAHAHVEVDHAHDKGETSLQIEIFRGAGRLPKDAMDLSGFIDKVGGALTNLTEERAFLASLNYNLKMSEWKPTVSLPYSPGALNATLPGVAQIAGLDFAFAEGVDQPLRRAFVTTYDRLDRMVVKLLLALTSPWDQGLPNKLFELGASQFPKFAVPNETRMHND